VSGMSSLNFSALTTRNHSQALGHCYAFCLGFDQSLASPFLLTKVAPRV
jgi:hypothetical protein